MELVGFVVVYVWDGESRDVEMLWEDEGLEACVCCGFPITIQDSRLYGVMAVSSIISLLMTMMMALDYILWR